MSVDEVLPQDRSIVVAAGVAAANVAADGTTPLTGLTDGAFYRATSGGRTTYFTLRGVVQITQAYVMTAAQYGALTNPDASTLYIIVG